MIEAQPSRTALRVALRRAAHQVHDARPLVFDDPLAVRILPAEFRAELMRTPDSKRRPFSAGLRAFMVARARFAEDTLAASVARGEATQYLVLGAGLDTFAYRNPFPGVRAFEVDHPATQVWKLECLREAGIAVPATAQHVAVDFERQELAECLREAGFDFRAVTVVAWLGVAPYLTMEAFRATLRVLAAMAEGSEAVFDYAYPREVLPERERLMLDSLSARVAQAGEPCQLFFTEETLRGELERAGLRMVENLGSEAMNQRYFPDRGDELGLRGSGGHVCHAATGERP
jgi:methyltransferase (TIGR00027 family)